MSERIIINLPGSTPITPLSPAIVAGGFVFVSGQVGFDPVERRFYGDDAASQIRGMLENLKTILVQAGSSLSKVVKTTVFLADIRDFAAMNGAYAEFFIGSRPARACVEVANIPRGALVEIEAVAYIGE